MSSFLYPTQLAISKARLGKHTSLGNGGTLRSITFGIEKLRILGLWSKDKYLPLYSKRGSNFLCSMKNSSEDVEKEDQALTEGSRHEGASLQTTSFPNMNKVTPTQSTIGAAAYFIFLYGLRPIFKVLGTWSQQLFHGNKETDLAPYEKSWFKPCEEAIIFFVTGTFLGQVGLCIAPSLIDPSLVMEYWQTMWVSSVCYMFSLFIEMWFKRGKNFRPFRFLEADQVCWFYITCHIFNLVVGLAIAVRLFSISHATIQKAIGASIFSSIFPPKGILQEPCRTLIKTVVSAVLDSTTNSSDPHDDAGQEKKGSATSNMSPPSEVTTPNVSESQAKLCSFVTEVPMMVEDHDKIHVISNAITSMLELDKDVTLDNEAPYCRSSHQEGSYVKLTIYCCMKPLSDKELCKRKDDIIAECVKIIRQHGGFLVDTRE